jgi:hypothetical protein
MHDEEKLWQIIDRLGDLQIGDTFSSTTQTIISHRTWATSLWRTYQGENRTQTMNYIVSVLEEAMDRFQLHPEEATMHRLLRAVQGLARLQFTYASDEALSAVIRNKCQYYNERIILLWQNNRVCEAVIYDSDSQAQCDGEESEEESEDEHEESEDEESEEESEVSSSEVSSIDSSDSTDVKKELPQSSPRASTQPMEIPKSGTITLGEQAYMRAKMARVRVLTHQPL